MLNDTCSPGPRVELIMLATSVIFEFSVRFGGAVLKNNKVQIFHIIGEKLQDKSLCVTCGKACYLVTKDHWDEIQGPNFRNFPKTFSKDLPMSDDLGISKKFSYPNFRRLSLRFQRTSSFLIFLN